MHVYVINLARSVDRRAHITAELKKTGLDYQIITAVDGRDLDLNDPTIVDPSLATKTVSMAGAAGCSLSHLSAYKNMIADGLDAALVLEDDVILPADLGSLADAVADQLVGAEVVLLNYSTPYPPCRLSREGSVHLPSSRLLALSIDADQWIVSSSAYIITREACERMIKCMPPIRVPIDDWRFFYREGTLDRMRCVAPVPVLNNAKLVSTIGSYTLGNGLRARILWPLVNHKVPLLHQALSYRRQRIQRRWSRSEIVDMPFVEKPSRLG
jgi:glycosyl transferase, family 25